MITPWGALEKEGACKHEVTSLKSWVVEVKQGVYARENLKEELPVFVTGCSDQNGGEDGGDWSTLWGQRLVLGRRPRICLGT